MFKLYNKIIVRTPVFKKGFLNESNIINLLKDTFFITAIKHSSKNLYEQVSLNQSISKTEEIALFTYAKRMSNRCTPFGFMAGTGLCDIKTSEDNQLLILNRKNIIYRLNGQFLTENNTTENNRSLYLNSTIRFHNNSLFYYEIHGSEPQVTYQLSEIEYDEVLFDLINSLNSKDCYNVREITDYFEKIGYSKKDSIESVNLLVNINIFISDQRTSVYEDIQNHSVDNENSHIIFKDLNLHEYHVDLGLNIKDFSITPKIKKSLIEGIKFMLNNLNIPTAESFEDFIDYFERRYGNNTISILDVFNPIIGMPYKSQSDIKESHSLLDIHRKSDNELLITKEEFKLINKLKNINIEIDTFEIDTDSLMNLNEFKKFPSSLNVSFKIVKDKGEDKIWIKYISGPTSLRHLNRFSNSFNDFQTTSQNIARHDKEYFGEDYLLCDLSFLHDKNSFSVINRKNFYDYYIDILGGMDKQSNSTRIPLNDIFLKMEDKQIVIFSKNLKKRIIPINSTAFNSNITNFPIYKFLCDYHSFYYKNSFYFNWGSLSAIFQTLPRVEFHNIILSPKKWNIKSKELNKLEKLSDLRHYLLKLGIHEQFILEDGDKEFHVNTLEDLSLESFLKKIKANRTLILSEYLESSITKDENEDKYESEFIVPILMSPNNIINNSNFEFSDDDIVIESMFPFDKEWLYIHIYLTEEIANKFLFEFQNQYLLNFEIQNFFYVRYYDPKFHLRLRIQFINQAVLIKFLSQFNKYIKTDKPIYGIYDYQIKSYQQEIDRYGAINMELIENLFSNDSLFHINNFKFYNNNNNNSIWIAPIHIVDNYLSFFNINDHEKIDFLNRWINNLLIDIKNQKYFRKKSSDIFRVLQNKLLFDEDSNSYKKNLTEMLEKANIKKLVNKNGLYSSIIHMSLNRYFEFDHLNNELMTYQLVVKYLKRKIAIKKTIN
ncbi:MAG: lantibiotic dehydratase [Brumimicrobium sp.]|nr:lantibiotic dehydratase [Brumimicrobium sp.]